MMRSPSLGLVAFGLAFLFGCAEVNPPSRPHARARCGDGDVESGEACDDGNTADGDGCSAVCQKEDLPPAPVCGDGIVEPTEACDDGNTADGDGCDAACQEEPPPAAVCGDGKVEAWEECDDGNAIEGDGCSAACAVASVVVTCADLAPLPEGTCEVVPGDASKLIAGTVLAPGFVYRGGQVLVDASGSIACVGCACDAMAAGATKIRCPEGVISPGLINTHDHITYAQNRPHKDSGERYEHRHDWRKGLGCHTIINTSGGASDDQIRWGELRFLMGGATSTLGSGSAKGLVRNLDKFDQEGLGQPPVELDTFPLGDSGGAKIAKGCGYPFITSAGSVTAPAYIAHVSEGIDVFARNEFACMSGGSEGGQDHVRPGSAFIHGVALTAANYAEMAKDGASLVWSPRSNVALYGDTAPAPVAARAGVRIALGTDWIASGSMNLLRELRCADRLNKGVYGGYFSDEDLWLMVTRAAAEVSAVDDVLGSLEAGKVADIAIFSGKVSKDHRAIIDAEPRDVALVMRGGKVLYGDKTVVAGVPGSGACDVIDVCGAEKSLCLMDDIGKGYAALKSSAGNVYEAFFCGDPVDEPSCDPVRTTSVSGSSVYTSQPSAGDADGDGVPDAADNCPAAWNPIRPVDGGSQADFDADGAGDACDPCPINAGAVACSPFDPADADADGKLDEADNCPAEANASQADGDSDGSGDACDLCPMESNPSGGPCTASIYAVKSGALPLGAVVRIPGALVTGVTTDGFYVQVKPGDAGYAGSDFSAIYVYDVGHGLAVGQRVSIQSATVAEFYGQLQLSKATLSPLGGSEATPPPIVVAPADVAPGGPKVKALEGALVEVKDVEVIALGPDPGQLTLTGEVVVGADLHAIAPAPEVGEGFLYLRGVLVGKFCAPQILPRDAADVALAPPKLKVFGPSPAFVYMGETAAPTIPAPLTVTLSRAAPADLFVSVTSSSPSLVVPNGGVTVLKDQKSAVVLVTADQDPSPGVTLTASAGGVSLTATVRIVDPAEQPVLMSLSPAAPIVKTGAAAELTVLLDIPAPAGGATVSLSLDAAATGSIPAQVFIPATQTAASFVYKAGAQIQEELVTASFGANSVMASVSVVGRLVLNEIDYDQPGTDNKEFVEIYNGTGAPVDLTGHVIEFVNGTNGTSYTSAADLTPAGTLSAGQYLVVVWNPELAGAIPPEAKTLSLTPTTGKIQNGAPDGIALINKAKGELIDALSYEGSVPPTAIASLPVPMSLVEGTPTSAADSDAIAGSLSRLPNGVDTDEASVNWAFSSAPTPGAPNAP